MKKTLFTSLLALGVLALSGTQVKAQDSAALVDALVRKGILTDQEAEEIRTDLTAEFAQTSAGKLNLASHITSLKLSGDVRLRYQWDQRQPQAPGAAPRADQTQRERARARVRLNADYSFTENLSGGVSLETEPNSDSGNQTLTGGFAKYPVFFSKFFLTWKATDYLTLTGGKQANPFYTTDLIWDNDISPTGGSEILDLGKLVDLPSNLSVQFRGGQFIYDDNAESSLDSDLNTDPWLFVNQVVASYKFNKDLSATFAPGFYTYISGNVNAATLVNENGVSGTEATRNLLVLTAPGEVSYALFGKPVRGFWDFAYNFDAKARTYGTYGVPRATNRSLEDSIAWLVGVGIGQNKVKGDWSLTTTFRQTGIGSIDPNLTDSDFAFSELNAQGIKTSAAYSLTDFVTGTVSYFNTWNYKANLNNPVAQDNTTSIVQVDLAFKF